MIKIILVLLMSNLNIFAYDRIIALSPSISEIIYALGAQDKIVGNTIFSTYPKEAKLKPKVGGFFSPNLEKILSLNPDIVIMQRSSEKLSRKLNRLGIKTKIVSLKRLIDIKNSILDIGKIVDKEKKAKDILNTLNNRLNSIKGIVKDKKILIVIGVNLNLTKRVFVVGQNLYFDDIINYSGNTNALQSSLSGQPILNMENIIATNADIVVLLTPFREKKGLSKKDLIKPWLNIPIEASKNKNIYIVDKEYAGIASDRLIYFLEDFKEFLENVKSKI